MEEGASADEILVFAAEQLQAGQRGVVEVVSCIAMYTAIQRVTALQSTAIRRYTLYNLYNTPLARAAASGEGGRLRALPHRVVTREAATRLSLLYELRAPQAAVFSPCRHGRSMDACPVCQYYPVR